MGAHRHNPTALAVARGERITRALIRTGDGPAVHIRIWGMELEFEEASTEAAKQEPAPSKATLTALAIAGALHVPPAGRVRR